MTLIIFIIVLAVLILVHEFGHFFAAKKFGVRVDEFGLGFPPKIWSKQIGETIYSLNLIPFGGFVKIFGENPDEESINGNDKTRSFVYLAKWKQVIVLSSGVLMNIILALFLFIIAYMFGFMGSTSHIDSKYVKNSSIIILDVLSDSPAEKAGIKAGDRIDYFSTKDLYNENPDISDLQKVISESNGESIILGVIKIDDNKEEIIEEISINPEKNIINNSENNHDENEKGYLIGVSMNSVGEIYLPFHKAVWEGTKLTFNLIINISISLFDLLKDAILGKADLSQVSGPVGIAKLAGKAGQSGFVELITLVAFISLNLAVLNMIPFPALDGGRILFTLIEAIKGSPIKPITSNSLNAGGFILLIIFLIYITYKDIFDRM